VLPNALLDSALLPRFNSSGVVQFVVVSRSFARATLAPAGSPGWHAPARRRIEADSADNDSLHFDSILSGGLFGILEPVRRFAAHLPRGLHAASNLPRWLSQGSSVWGGSFCTFVLLPNVWRWRILSPR